MSKKEETELTPKQLSMLLFCVTALVVMFSGWSSDKARAETEDIREELIESESRVKILEEEKEELRIRLMENELDCKKAVGVEDSRCCNTLEEVNYGLAACLTHLNQIQLNISDD